MREKIRTIIVDDEPLARDGVRLHLAAAADVDIIGEAGSGEEAVELIETLRPDLMFLDVQMPGIDGFGVLEAVGTSHMPVTVFTTAHDEFAVRAFDAHAIDYILKPYDTERFGKALERARSQVRSRRQHREDDRLRTLLEELQQARPRRSERLVVRSGGRIVLLQTSEIDWVEAASNYVRLHAGGKEYLLRETMTALEEKLDPAEFLRIHRSTIVRIDRIRELEPLFQGDYVVILKDDTRLTSSRGYRERLQELLQGSR
ncbi:MAG TPA: LytTR family DNA-binding domain-containing protein [Longimicrobiales bacterium]|nr:LytTR family DNA-binding domain-containing protein [Longimicrobiales bacterium]